MSLGKNIKYFRKKSGLTQVALAEKANISRSYLADVENDRYNASLEVIGKISTALNISISSLLDEDTDLYRTESNFVETKNKILNILKTLTDDEGFFHANLRKEVFDSFVYSLDITPSLHEPPSNYYIEKMGYFFEHPDEHTKSDKIEFIDSFNEMYNYRAIKKALDYQCNNVYDILNTLERIAASNKNDNKKLDWDDNPLYLQFLNHASELFQSMTSSNSNENLVKYVVLEAYTAFEMRLNEILLTNMKHKGTNSEMSLDYLNRLSIFDKLTVTLKNYLDLDITSEEFYSELLMCINIRNLIAHGELIRIKEVDVKKYLNTITTFIEFINKKAIDKKEK